jgi:hypothetical protein
MRQLLWPQADREGPIVYNGEGAHQLWNRRGRSPQWPKSLVIDDSGAVTVRPNPTFGYDGSDFDQFTVLVGGKDYRFDDTDPTYLALVAAGYSFRDV